MDRYAAHLRWIDAQQERMIRLIVRWCEINAGTYNVPGVEHCAMAVLGEMSVLGADVQRIKVPAQLWIEANGAESVRPLAPVIHLVKRPEARLRIFLGIHLDTVYADDDAFQHVTRPQPRILQGPGVADAKGGLAVLLIALEALEQSPFADQIGWEVLLNTDEEIGSPGSAPLFSQAASRNTLGLLFEPALPDGSLAGARKGSGNFTAVMTGRSAHAGRDPQAGRNAIHAAAELVSAIAALNSPAEGISANVGQIEGGTAPNVVPDRTICRLNVRVRTPSQQQQIEASLAELVARFNAREGFSLRLHGGFSAPPKLINPAMQRLLELVADCGRALNVEIAWHDTGGVCDGNRLAAAGLPNIDTLGPRGGNLHSPGEFLVLDSLTERAKLTALLLMRLASGELNWMEA